MKMGSSQSHPIFLALQELFESKKLKMKRSTMLTFLSECDIVAPWFAVSGNLSLPCWDKLGRDLDFAWEQGSLKPGVRPIWRLVRSCLEDQKCHQHAIEQGQAALEQLQEERSEAALSETGDKEKGGRIKTIYLSLTHLRKEEKSDSEENSSGQDNEEDAEKEIKKIDKILWKACSREYTKEKFSQEGGEL